MRTRNKPAQTALEARYVGALAVLPCVVCGAPGPSEVHEFEQGQWFTSVPLCHACHHAPQGWHGTRLRWTLRKMDMLKAINLTVARVLHCLLG